MAWDDGLEGTARDIAASSARIQRVLAGPGTGKSYALQRKVIRLLEVEQADPRRILAVTFTRVAAADLRKSMSELGVAGCEDVDARTLHSYCFGLLSRTGILPLLDRVPRPLIKVEKLGWLQYEYDPLLCDIGREEFGDKRELIERLSLYEADWAKLQHDIPGVLAAE
jgi:superfamily I DNA/RNA helicase